VLATALVLAGPAALAATPDAVTIHTRSDRMTLQLAKAPQIYIAGTFNDDAVRQVGALLASGKVSAGSDVYLDSTAGDVGAGIELGRLFRTARVNTHVGAWRTPGRHTLPAPPASCLDACAYAYLGGVYRWAPSGRDRIGLHVDALPGDATTTQAGPSPKDRQDYLEAMDVRAEWFAHVLTAPQDGIVWWDAGEMAPWLVANNGRQALEATYDATPANPRLVLSQTVKGGQNRVTLRCAPQQVAVTAHYRIGYQQATHVASRAMYAYFEIGRHALEKRKGDLPQVDGDALVFTRELPFADLADLLHTLSLGAWIEVSGSPVRLGFQLAPAVAEQRTAPFLADCAAMQPGYKPPEPHAEPDKPSFWKRLFGRVS
jgi:hypothetical protein